MVVQVETLREEVEEEEQAAEEVIVEEFERKSVTKQEQNVMRIRYFTKNKETGAQEEIGQIRPLTGSKWNLAPNNTATNPYRTFDNQPIYKVPNFLNPIHLLIID